MKLSTLLSLGLDHFSLDVKKTQSKVTVVFSPKSKSEDPAIKNLKPLIINFYSVEEMDEKFLELVTVPVQKTVQLFNGVEQYEKDLAEASKKTKAAAAEKTAAAKKKEEAKKATPKLDFDTAEEKDKPEVSKEVKAKEVPAAVEPVKEEVPAQPEPVKEVEKPIEEKAPEPETPTIEEASVTEEVIEEKNEEPEVVDATDQTEAEQNDLFSSMPDLFS